jgi:hypothetical protein
MASWHDVGLKLDLLRKQARAIVTESGRARMPYVAQPLTAAEVEALEHGLGVRLPEDYRDFLMEIGCGWKAGPHWPWSPSEILREATDWLQEFESQVEWEWRANKLLPKPCANEKVGWPSPDRPFPFNRAQAESIPQGWVWNGSSWVWPSFLEAPCPAPGCVVYADSDGQRNTVLVTAGELTGSVWDVDFGEYPHAFWLPARCASFRRRSEAPHLPLVPTFREWYTDWLDHELA